MKYDKTCRNCEYAYLKTCKSCNTFGGNTYENFKLRNELQKIENGTLVELPKPYIEEIKCESGETMYEVWHSRIETHCSYVEDTFTTKTEAEARLKELNEKE